MQKCKRIGGAVMFLMKFSLYEFICFCVLKYSVEYYERSEPLTLVLMVKCILCISDVNTCITLMHPETIDHICKSHELPDKEITSNDIYTIKENWSVCLVISK